jgi:hypothetical protein
MGTQSSMIRTLAKVGLPVPAPISLKAQADGPHTDFQGVDQMLAIGVRYAVWQVDQALACTNLNTLQRMKFKDRLDQVGLLVGNDEADSIQRVETIYC